MSDGWELTPFGKFLVKSLAILTLAGLHGGFGYTAYEHGGTIGFVAYQSTVMAIAALLYILKRPRWLADTPLWIFIGTFALAPTTTREMLGWPYARSTVVWVIASAVYIAVVLLGRRIFSPKET